MVYCARTDVYAIGLAPEAFRRPPREVEAVTPATGTLTIRSHGLAPNAPVSLAVLSSSTLGAPVAAVPTGTAVATPYYALPVAGSSDLFQIAIAPNGAPLTFSDAGAGVFGVLVDHGAYLDAAIVAASAVFDQYARAHASPIVADVARVLCAYLAARIYGMAHAAGNPAFMVAAEAPSWLRGILDKLFQIYMEGAPILGATDATPTTAEAGAILVALAPGNFDLIDDGTSSSAVSGSLSGLDIA